MALKPFLKWAGGKSQILREIQKFYPAGLGTLITKYAEPFVGGGAVLFDIISGYKFREIYISDINRELIAAYMTIRDNADELIGTLRNIESQYLPADEDVRKEIYYANRDRFNVLKAIGDESIELAALFIFLNRTCFNGLYRVNSRGAFNVPQGRYKNPTLCDETNLLAISKALKNVNIVCGDYRLSREFIDDKTFAYFDPPYRPLNATSNFTAYSNDCFGDKEQELLARFVDEMRTRGATILASNSDPKNADSCDDFFDRLYSRHRITRINACRAINSVASSRGKIHELLISS